MNLQKDLVTVSFTEEEADAIRKEILKLIISKKFKGVIEFAKEYPNLKELQYILNRNKGKNDYCITSL